MRRLCEHHWAIEDRDLPHQSLVILSAFVRLSALTTSLTFKISGQLQRLFDVYHDGCWVCLSAEIILRDVFTTESERKVKGQQ